VILVGAVVAVVASGATARSSAKLQVCVLLPDTKSSVRWVQFDAPDWAKALKKAHLTYSITNALNDPQKMVSQADSCLSRGAKIAVVTDIAQGTSIAIEKKFAKAGGQSIDYDRQVVGDERPADLRADAAEDEQQDRWRRRGERQHRRRRGRRPEGEEAEADRAVGTGRNRPRRAEHHLGLAVDDRLQVRAPRGQRCR